MQQLRWQQQFKCWNFAALTAGGGDGGGRQRTLRLVLKRPRMGFSFGPSSFFLGGILPAEEGYRICRRRSAITHRLPDLNMRCSAGGPMAPIFADGFLSTAEGRRDALARKPSLQEPACSPAASSYATLQPETFHERLSAARRACAPSPAPTAHLAADAAVAAGGGGVSRGRA